VFLELAEALDCPECRSSVGLVAFVEESASHRVIRGWLGCPLCEIEFPISDGAIDVRASGGDLPPARESADDEGHPDAAVWGGVRPTVPLDLVIRLAASLGVTEPRGKLVVLGPGLAAHASELARLGEKTEVLAWLEDRDAAASSLTSESLSTGVNPFLGVAPGRWPLRSASLGGLALLGPIGPQLSEAERCARPGSRLVLLCHAPLDLELLASSDFDEMVRDEITWIGERR